MSGGVKRYSLVRRAYRVPSTVRTVEKDRLRKGAFAWLLDRIRTDSQRIQAVKCVESPGTENSVLEIRVVGTYLTYFEYDCSYW